MNTRCYRCGWSFSLSRDTISAAVAQAEATKAKYHVEHCPKCRQAIKLPVDQLKRAAAHAPAPAPESDKASSG
jgi:hypothetical protein